LSRPTPTTPPVVVWAASGKAEGPADTGVVSADPDNAAGRPLGAAGAARQWGDTP